MTEETTVPLLQWTYATALFLCGLLAGSLLNSIAFRWPRGIALLSPPPVCPRCNRPLPLKDAIPLLSYLLLKGRCRQCQGRIHPRLPIIELLTGLLWAWNGHHLAALRLPLLPATAMGIVTLVFISAMILTALIDWDHHIIPNAITHTGLIASIAVAPILPWLHHAENPVAFARRHPVLAMLLPGQQPWQHAIAASLSGAAIGLAFSMMIYYLGGRAFKNQAAKANVESAIGMGDVKLTTSLGAFLGGDTVLIIFAIGAVLGAGTGIVMKVRSGSAGNETGWNGLRRRWESGISLLPFGPFLAIGALACFFMGERFAKLLHLAA